MWIRKRWAPSPSSQVLSTTKSSISFQQIIQGHHELVLEQNTNCTVAALNPRNYCIPRTDTSSADSSSISSSLSHQEGGHWLEEDKILPLKKRRVQLNLENQPKSNAETVVVLQGDLIKNIWNERTSRKCTIKKSADTILEKDDDYERAILVMNSSPAAKDIKMAENYTNNTSPTTRCTRTNGRGWRCSQQCFSGYRMCEHHFIASKGCRKKKKKKKNKNSSTRHKEVALKVKIAPINATKVVQRELKNVGNSRTSRNWSDNFFAKDDDFEWISEVMDNTEAEKKIRMAENTINNSTIARCIRSNGKGWRCSQPSVAGYTMCEHHCALAKNGRRRDRKQKKKKKKKKTETLLQNELRNIGNSTRSRKWPNKIWSDHVILNKDDDFGWLLEVMNNASSPATKEMKMEENIIHNRYGRGWSCSEPSFGNYSEYEHHLDASKNTRRKEKKKKNNIPCKVTESKIKSTTKTEFTDLDNRLNFSDTESCDESDDYHECVFKVENCSF